MHVEAKSLHLSITVCISVNAKHEQNDQPHCNTNSVHILANYYKSPISLMMQNPKRKTLCIKGPPIRYLQCFVINTICVVLACTQQLANNRF